MVLRCTPTRPGGSTRPSIGPIATFGYWIGWSVVLAANGLFIGSIIEWTWFSGEPGGSYLAADGYFSTAVRTFGLPALIAIGLILGVWLFNVFGPRVGVTFGYVAGVLLMVPLFVMMILPFLNGSFDSANLTNNLGDSGLAWGGLQVALVWLWLMCWSAWGVDVCATFAPEYKDTVRDTKLALRSAALFSMVVYIVLPIGLRRRRRPQARRGLRLRRRDGQRSSARHGSRTSSSSASSRASSSP